MILPIYDFIRELPAALIFGIAFSLSALVAVFAPNFIYRVLSIFARNDGSERELTPVPSSASVSACGTQRPHRPRRLRRNPLKRIYSNFVQDRDDSSPSDENGSGQPVRKRRHSTGGPFNFIRNRAYKRQYSEAFRGSLPKPPTEFFVPSEIPAIPPGYSAEMFYMKTHLSVLELPEELALTQDDIVVRWLNTDEVLVKPGDSDNCVYVVLEGSLNAYISPCEGKLCMVKRIEAGNSFFSMLSLLDILMQMPSKFKTVSVKAAERTKIAVYSLDRLANGFKDNPEMWIRPIQIIVNRLLHVTLTTLYQHLGLGLQLLKRVCTNSGNEFFQKVDDKFDDRNRHVSGHSMRLKNARGFRQRRLSSSDAHADGPRHRGLCRSQVSVDEGFAYHHGLQTRRRIMIIAEDQNELHNLAVRWFGEALGLESGDANDLLQSRIIINNLDEGHILSEQGSTDAPQLILVLQGSLKITQDNEEDDENGGPTDWLTMIQPREVVGGLQLLTNEPNFFTLSAAAPSMIAVLSLQSFNEIVALRPQIYLPVAFSVLRRLSTFVRAVDFAIDWVLVDSGQALYRTGDEAESMFVVLSGRLRSVDKKAAIEEFGRGDSLGLIEVLQKKPRSTTVLAVRYSQLARVPEGLLNFVKLQYPQVGFRLIRLLGQSYAEKSRLMPMITAHAENQSADPLTEVKNLHTVALMPASLDVPLAAFGCELFHALNTNTRVLRLNSKKIAEILGENCLEKNADFGLMHWLNAQEDTYSLIVYECDYTATNWTRRCLRQADTILVVGMGEKRAPKHQLLEDHLNMNQDGIRTTKKLVLLWKEETDHPTGTFEWLKGSWFSGHFHIRAPDRMFQWSWNADERDVTDFYSAAVFSGRIDFNSDFARLARILTGNAIGLVLGGGGARGAAHIGVIRAMREHGIPIDIVGGTSIGSLIGGTYAEQPEGEFEDKAKSWFSIMSSLWRKIWDLTYWHSAMFTGAGFNATLQDVFGTKCIEDLWIPYFCITTDISTSEMRVHRSGPLWTYSRASMSLAGYLPPLCDPADGHLLLDGGYVNNLPADVMRSMGARCVVAVDVGAASETNLYNYGDSLSGFWVLLKRLNPFAEKVRILRMDEIQSRLAFVSCSRQLEVVKKAPYCQYLRPPIESFETLEFNKFDVIKEVGYKYASVVFSELVQTNSNIKAVMNPEKLRSLKLRRRRERNASARDSFTDLAAQISRIPGKNRGSMTDVSVFDEDWHDDSSDLDSYEDLSEVEDEESLTRSHTPRI